MVLDPFLLNLLLTALDANMDAPSFIGIRRLAFHRFAPLGLRCCGVASLCSAWVAVLHRLAPQRSDAKAMQADHRGGSPP